MDSTAELREIVKNMAIGVFEAFYAQAAEEDLAIFGVYVEEAERRYLQGESII